MSLEKKVYQYAEIVPPAPEPTFAERYLPTFLAVGRRAGIIKTPEQPVAPNVEYGQNITIQFPLIPLDKGGEEHELLYLFARLADVADRTIKTPDQETIYNCRMNEFDFQRAMDFNFRGDGTMFGDVMFQMLALKQYADQFFDERGYVATCAGVEMLDKISRIKIGLAKLARPIEEYKSEEPRFRALMFPQQTND